MTEIKIDEHNLISQLRAVFPEIEERYRKELQDWKDEPPGNYNILGFVFKPYLKEELAKGELTDFLERLAKLSKGSAQGDIEAINVIWLKSSSCSWLSQKSLNFSGLCSAQQPNRYIQDAASAMGPHREPAGVGKVGSYWW